MTGNLYVKETTDSSNGKQSTTLLVSLLSSVGDSLVSHDGA